MSSEGRANRRITRPLVDADPPNAQRNPAGGFREGRVAAPVLTTSQRPHERDIEVALRRTDCCQCSGIEADAEVLARNPSGAQPWHIVRKRGENEVEDLELLGSRELACDLADEQPAASAVTKQRWW